MLHGTCLNEALQLWHQGLEADGSSDSDDEDKYNGPNGNGETGHNLDLNDKGNEDDPPGPVDSPPIFSKVILTLRRGLMFPPLFIRNLC